MTRALALSAAALCAAACVPKLNATCTSGDQCPGGLCIDSVCMVLDTQTPVDAGPGSDAGPFCGDGVQNGGETCDDGRPDECGTCNTQCTGSGNGHPHSLCGRSVCADGSVEQIFPYFVGCSGSVSWSEGISLCNKGWRLTPAIDWNTVIQVNPNTVPKHDYWTADQLRFNGSGPFNCSVSTTSGSLCSPGDRPMRVCTAGGGDAESNTCLWNNCGYEQITPNYYYGGCAGDPTAGALCSPPFSPCASGSSAESFGLFMAGCAGAVSSLSRNTLCARGCSSCTLDDWMVQADKGQVPSQDYWVDDQLYLHVEVGGCYGSSESVVENCDSPLRVCATVQPDANGNNCGAKIGCGYQTPSRQAHLGGCGGGTTTSTAGTLCCCP